MCVCVCVCVCVCQCIVWNTKTRQPARVVDVHSDLVLCLAWNRNGSLFATTSRDGLIRVIEPRSGSVVSVCDLTLACRPVRSTGLTQHNVDLPLLSSYPQDDNSLNFLLPAQNRIRFTIILFHSAWVLFVPDDGLHPHYS